MIRPNRLAAILVTGSLALLSAAGQATAGPAPADLVFQSGGRIVAVKADGSDRKVLTRPWSPAPFMVDDGLVVTNDETPSISPDGTKLLFLRSGYSRKSHRSFYKVMVADRDGSDAKSLWGVSKYSRLADPAWTGKGGSVVFTEISLRKPMSYQEETIYRFRKMTPGSKRPVNLWREVFGPETADQWGYQSRRLEGLRLDPAGRRVVFESVDHRRTSLVVRDLASGRTRTIARRGIDPSFSPNGGRIVFARAGAIFVVGADGTGMRRVLNQPGEARAPEFSPDGTRIAFHSDRNFPIGKRDSNEIYTVKPDGSCLTWLTNGSPESETPSWDPDPDRSFAPGECGAAIGLTALVEFHDQKPPTWGPHYNLWAGPRVQGRLLSSPAPADWGTVDYADCAYFNRSRCEGPVYIGFQSQCDSIASNVEYGNAVSVTTRRGAIVVRTKKDGHLSGTLVSTGRKDVIIGQDDWDFPHEDMKWGRQTPFSDHLAFIDALRPLKSNGPPSGDLPKPRISMQVSRYLKRSERLLERTGSYEKTAELLKSRPVWVKDDLAWYGQLKSMGPVETFRCDRS